MPKGIPNNKGITIIDVAPRNGIRGRMDKLQREFLMKAEALRIAADILDADERQQALEAHPKKLLQAMNHREAHRPEPTTIVRKSQTERRSEVVDFLRHQPQATIREVAAGIGMSSNGHGIQELVREVAKITGKRGKENLWTLRKSKAHVITARAKQAAKHVNGNGNGHRKQRSGWAQKLAISGKPLTLFLLENLDEQNGRSAADLAQRLADAGSPIQSLRNLNGPLGALSKSLAKKNGSGFLRTPKGSAHVVVLRQQLEAKGLITPGGYAQA